MTDEKPFHHMVNNPTACSDFIGNLIYKIMTDAKSVGQLQHVEAIGELTKHIIRSWYLLELEYEVRPLESKAKSDEND